MKLYFDPSVDSVRDVIDQCRETDVWTGSGTNENGEDILIDVTDTFVVVTTFQNNHWIRVNTYYIDGTVDETFDGKWEE